jgi:hypothetical protein
MLVAVLLKHGFRMSLYYNLLLWAAGYYFESAGYYLTGGLLLILKRQLCTSSD